MISTMLLKSLHLLVIYIYKVKLAGETRKWILSWGHQLPLPLIISNVASYLILYVIFFSGLSQIFLESKSMNLINAVRVSKPYT